MTIAFKYRKTMIAAAVSATLVIMPSANAIPVLESTSSYDLFDYDVNTGAYTSYRGNMLSNVSNTYATTELSDSEATSSTATKGIVNDNGWIYSRSRAAGIAASGTSTSMRETFTNNSAGAQNYTYDFNINQGSISAYQDSDPDAAFESYESALAYYAVTILLNGDSVFDSSAQLMLDPNGVTFLDDGSTSLGTYSTDSSYYSWGAQSHTLDLGLVDAGDGFTLEYRIQTFATANTGSYDCSYDGYGDGYGDIDGYGDNLPRIDIDLVNSLSAEFGTVFCAKGSSYAQFGDPALVSSTPLSPFSGVTPQNATAASVSEPGNLALLAIGLGGLAGARKRKQNKA